MKTGIYIHIPYCLKKCDYCDFYSVGDQSSQKEYFAAIKQEMEQYRNQKIPVDSVFIGGGTPSVPAAEHISDILNTVREVFSVADDSEITIELNPKTFDKNKLKIYREAGINRVSMGLQSANNDELKKLGRIHTAEEFLASYELLRNMGFSNINTDIMYGLPDSSENSLENTLQFLQKLSCEHISAYALTLAESSVLYQRGYRFPDDDGVYRQYRMVCEALSDYRHYEISNFVKQGVSPCRHNLKYWLYEPYLGFGAAAHSFFRNTRFENPSDIKEYIAKIQQEKLPENRQVIFGEEERLERLMLSLRTDRGLFWEDFPPSFCTNNIAFLKQAEKNGYITPTENGFRLTENGFFVSNAIISSLVL